MVAAIFTSSSLLTSDANAQNPPGGGEPGYKVRYLAPLGVWRSEDLNENEETGLYEPIEGSGPHGKTVGTGGADYDEDPPYFTGPGYASCDGVITAEFYWDDAGDPSNLPPDIVIVRQESIASWAGDSGSCSNGLGDDPVGGTYGKTSSGVYYSVKEDPGESFTITCVPEASTYVSGNIQEVGQSGSASVQYTATAILVKIQFSGVVDPDDDKRLIIGQRLTSTVVYDSDPAYPPAFPPPFTTGTYSWTVPSLLYPFDGYLATDNVGTLFPFESPDSITMECYFAAFGSGDVKCDVSFPSLGLSFTVSDTIGLVKPTYEEFGGPILGKFWLIKNGGAYDVIAYPDQFRLYADPISSVGLNAGLKVPMRVTDYGPPFTDEESNYGYWNPTQLVQPTVWLEYAGGTRVYGDHTGEWGLDQQFPYIGSFPAKPTQTVVWFADSPGFPQGLVNQPPYASPLKAHWYGSFKIYTLYDPPGVSEWVPLALLNWTANGEAEYFSSDGKWHTTVNGSTVGEWSDWSFHPEWTFRHISAP